LIEAGSVYPKTSLRNRAHCSADSLPCCTAVFGQPICLSLNRSRWSAGRFRKLRSHDIEATFRALRQEIHALQVARYGRLGLIGHNQREARSSRKIPSVGLHGVSFDIGTKRAVSYFLSDDYARKGRCERPARSRGDSPPANGRPPADNSEDWKGPAYQTCIHAAAA
jgi:hypothetical protein